MKRNDETEAMGDKRQRVDAHANGGTIGDRLRTSMDDAAAARAREVAAAQPPPQPFPPGDPVAQYLKPRAPWETPECAGFMVFSPSASHVLMVYDKRRSAAGEIRWVLGFPKGKVEGDESLMECAQRELQEETGLSLTELQLSRAVPYVEEMYVSSGVTTRLYVAAMKHPGLLPAAWTTPGTLSPTSAATTLGLPSLRPRREDAVQRAQWLPVGTALLMPNGNGDLVTKKGVLREMRGTSVVDHPVAVLSAARKRSLQSGLRALYFSFLRPFLSGSTEPPAWPKTVPSEEAAAAENEQMLDHSTSNDGPQDQQAIVVDGEGKSAEGDVAAVAAARESQIAGLDHVVRITELWAASRCPQVETCSAVVTALAEGGAAVLEKFVGQEKVLQNLARRVSLYCTDDGTMSAALQRFVLAVWQTEGAVKDLLPSLQRAVLTENMVWGRVVLQQLQREGVKLRSDAALPRFWLPLLAYYHVSRNGMKLLQWMVMYREHQTLPRSLVSQLKSALREEGWLEQPLLTTHGNAPSKPCRVPKSTSLVSKFETLLDTVVESPDMRLDTLGRV